VATFPNDYAGISEASSEGTVVSKTSPMGQSAEEFVDSLLEREDPKPDRNGHKFLEHFSTASETIRRKRGALVKVGGHR
jgi:hypothetical protein